MVRSNGKRAGRGLLSGRRIGRRIAAAALSLALALAMAAAPALAQGGASPERLRQDIERLMQGRGIEELPRRAPASVAGAAGAAPVASTAALAPEPPSPAERLFSVRAGEPLRLFGLDLFANAAARFAGGSAPPAGAVGGDYLLGAGDELLIVFRGGLNRTLTVPVERDGRVILPDLRPLPAGGRRLDEFRRDLAGAAAAAFVRTEVFVTLDAIRQIAVTVAGEVRQPGLVRLPSTATMLQALVAAGGVARGGSLRRMRLVRAGRSVPLDAYDLLAGDGAAFDAPLVDGDRILVPVLGAVVAVAGEVQRPALFELPAGATQAESAAILELAGGALRPTGSRFLVSRPEPRGRDRLIEAGSQPPALLSRGDLLLVRAGAGAGGRAGVVRIEGHVRSPGEVGLAAAASLGALLRSGEVLLPAPYLPFAALQTTDPASRARVFRVVSLEAAVAGRGDVALRPDDLLVVLSQADMQYLASADVQRVLRGLAPASLELFAARGGGAPSAMPADIPERAGAAGAAEEAAAVGAGLAPRMTIRPGELRGMADRGELAALIRRATPERADGARDAPAPREGFAGNLCNGLHALAAIVRGARPGRFANAVRGAHDLETRAPIGFDNLMPCPPVFDRYPELLPLAIEHVAVVEGEVRQPGPYPVAPGTSLASLLALAGQVTRNADMARVELSRAARPAEGGPVATVTHRRLDLSASRALVRIDPGDVVRIPVRPNDWDDGPVALLGEVRRPGFYPVRRGERLSELIERAGGLSGQAYPLGAVLTRESARRAERAAFERAAQELEAAMPVALSRSGEAGARAAASVPALSQLVRTLRDAPAVGRVVIEADPAALAARPELDITLEPGDRLFVPKRPNSVQVAGEVLNVTSLQFRSGLQPHDYIRMAGGTRVTADERRIFVLLPNGEAQPVGASFWNFRPVNVPPGAVIVVPRDPLPFDALGLTRDLTGILGQLALAAASVAVISRR
ncbi:MAG: SLBB domain-containing protein [Alphaproteobacteria bacterium]|nr:SLBB domain-containing protein [Alphaproteobacteria bacterium]